MARYLVELRLSRDEALQDIQDTGALVPNIAEPNSRSLFLARCKNLDLTFDIFNRTHSDIRSNCVKLDKMEEYTADVAKLSAYKTEFYNIVAAKASLDKEVNVASSSNAPAVPQRPIQLPNLQLPVFDGTLKNWQYFFDTFSSLIHTNSSLSDIDKFHYLLLSTKGMANSVVSSLPLTAANYGTAWQSLLERYNDTRVLSIHYLDSLLNLKPLSDDSYESLQSFYITAHDNLLALSKSKIPDLADFILLSLLLRRADCTTRQKFELRFGKKQFPTAHDFLSFLREKCQALELSQSHATPRQSFKTKATMPIPKRSFHFAENTLQCPRCRGPHRLSRCEEYLSLSINQRREFVKTNKLCFNCFANSHMIKDCQSKYTCRTCNGKHHSLLHFDFAKDDIPSRNPNHDSHESRGAVSHALSCNTPTTVLLGTAVALIKDGHGSLQKVRLMIDSGSQLSFITSACVKRLRLNIKSKSTPILGLGNTTISCAKGKVLCELQSTQDPPILLSTLAVILPKITTDLPNASLPSRLRHDVQHIVLADPDFDRPGPIDFLLGADLFPHILRGADSLPLPCGLSAISTIFGWILLGRINGIPSSSESSTSLLGLDNLQVDLKRFWEVEEPQTNTISSPEDNEVEEHFVNSHYRTDNGRYVVSLPFKRGALLEFAYSRQLAHGRFLNLESRLSRNPPLRAAYGSFMKDYKDLGHMTRTNRSGLYLIPHHCVYKDLQSLFKIRVVFDASARPWPRLNSTVSLNDVLLPGPKLQHDVGDRILNFRCHQVVFTTDICKMYRQILVAPSDCSFQHILWREHPGQPIDEYELRTVTYGLSCAPFLALRVIQQLASDGQLTFPLASRVLRNDVYVDDIVTGAQILEEALHLKNELVLLLASAGFTLKKWTSNSPEFLEQVPIEDREPSLDINSGESPSVKILGIRFDAEADSFTYNVSPTVGTATKRSILSSISRIFDPLGWISPVVFLAKRFMQDIWKANVDWDDPLPNSLLDLWLTFKVQMSSLSAVKIPRLILPKSCSNSIIVGFCDASEDGYAAVIYLRTESSPETPDNVGISLLKSKTRVAPLRSLSVSRLELCAAVLLSKLFQSLVPLIDRLSIFQFVLCSDSTIALSWLKTPPYQLKTFVANRVVEVTNHTSATDWYHVESGFNSADCASRGLFPEQILSHALWSQGPSWLRQRRELWPLSGFCPDSLHDISDVKPSKLTCVAAQETNFWIDWIQRFSNLLKLKFSMSFVLRFIGNTRKHPVYKGFLSTTELQTSLQILIKHTQAFYYAEEIAVIQAGNVSKRLQKLSPFMDQAGVLRVGGRLQFSALAFHEKHPILLPKNAHLTLLIVKHYHTVHMHAGTRTLQALLGRRFWIIASRLVIRRCVSQCLICSKLRAQVITPLMGHLPHSRVNPSRPFVKVGVDFAGPFLLKESTRKNAKICKGYFCIFVCMATRAVHLEAVTELSTEAFLATFDRFIARRGLCTNIYSDCGTNFVGAARCLSELSEFWRNQEVHRRIGGKLAQRDIIWSFNPPAAPHFGGLWEAGVKSVKHHLTRVVGTRSLTYEEFATVLAKIEAILNSRPLCTLPSDVEELEYLTPGHFPIGSPLLSCPEPDYEGDVTLTKRWQLTRQITQHFWRRWSSEYLQTLQQKSKWTTASQTLAPGDVVFLITPNSAPLHWP